MSPREIKKKPPTEANFQRRVIQRLKSIKGLYYFKKEAKAIRGIPDIIICYKGQFFAWELKRSEKHQATALQKHNIAKINKAGGYAAIVYPENFAEELEKLLNYDSLNSSHQ